jgi:hypothetical protein
MQYKRQSPVLRRWEVQCSHNWRAWLPSLLLAHSCRHWLLLLLLLQINKAFSERRKMMRNTLQPLYTPQQVR